MPANIVIASAKVPFISGGAETHAAQLAQALQQAGHQVEIFTLPFSWQPPEKMLSAMLAHQLLDLQSAAGSSVDRLITLKFPTWMIEHPHKSVWVLHQHRSAYENWARDDYGDLANQPQGAAVRAAIMAADNHYLAGAERLFANSKTVAARLWQFNALKAEPLYHPPADAEKFYCGAVHDYFFFPSRITNMKRQALVVEALAYTREPVQVRFAGSAHDARDFAAIQARARFLAVNQKIQWLGQISETEKREAYAHSLAVIYPPFEEDYGYVTLEAALACKAVLTCQDSGGPLEFVQHGHNGWVCQPSPQALALALDEAWQQRTNTAQRGQALRATYEAAHITWRNVIEKLID